MTVDKALLEAVGRRSLAELRKAVVGWEPVYPGENQQQKKPGGLSDMELQVAEAIARHPCHSIEKRCQQLGVNRAVEGLARKRLAELGLVREAGKRGKSVYFEPTAKGKEWAEERGIQLPAFKSGVVHEAVLQDLAAALGGQEGVQFRVGVNLDGVQADGLVTTAEGRAMAVQVSHSNKPGAEAEALLRLARHELLDRTLLVATSKGKAQAIRRKLAELLAAAGEEAALRAKVVVLDADTALASYDWSKVWEGRG